MKIYETFLLGFLSMETPGRPPSLAGRPDV